MRSSFVAALLGLTSATIIIGESRFESQEENGLPTPPRPNPRPLPPFIRGLCFDLDNPGEKIMMGISTDCPFDTDVLKFWRWNALC